MPAGKHFLPGIFLAMIAWRSFMPLYSAEPRPQPAPRPKQVSTTGGMHVSTADAEGKALPGSAIHVSVWTDEDFDHNQDYFTDAAGHVEINLPKTLTILRIWADSDGYVPLFAGWWPERQKDDSRIPDEFAFHLAKGTAVGGVVTNAEGQPISGAKIEVMHVDSVDELNVRPVVDTWLALGSSASITNDEGRWTLNNVPADKQTELQLKISHPDYINDQVWGDMQQKQNVTMEQLRAKTAVIVMRRGIRLAGTVTDAAGNPVAGVVVIHGDKPYMQEGSQELRTGEDGTFRFPPLSSGPMTVTVVAEGWMPQLRKIEITPENPPVDFKLALGKTLRLRFVDFAGQPVPNVFVQIAKWRGGESLYNFKHPNVLDTKIPHAADANGIYEWTWAPDDAVTYHFYRSAQEVPAWTTMNIAANGVERTITLPALQAESHISGSVTDSETGEPIAEFTAFPVLELTHGELLVRRSQLKLASGRYSLEMEHRDTTYRVRIEAPGYRSALSEAKFRFGDAKTNCDFALHRALPATGRVVNAKGKPVSGAIVRLATATQPLHLVQKHQKKQWSANYGTQVDARATNTNGEFSFPAQHERYFIAVSSGEGYAECHRRPEESPGKMVLSDFAKIEGNVRNAGQPADGAEIIISPIRLHRADGPRLAERMTARTDSDGRFAIIGMPPLKCALAWKCSSSQEEAGGTSESIPLDLQPGETANVGVLGAGAEIRGQVVLQGEQASEIDFSRSLNYMLRKTRGIKPPLEIALHRFDWRAGWSNQWISTPEGNAYLQTLHHYRVKLNRDGTFRVTGAPGGEYELALHIYGRKNERAVTSLAAKVVKFTVADEEETTGGIDLGEIEITAPLNRDTSKPVTDFEAMLLNESGGN